jgi:hypothetical protein
LLPLKYGSLITVAIVVWVLVAHLLVPNPCSPVHIVGPIMFFNLAEICGIYLGLGALKRESGGRLQFKDGLKTGVAIAVVYGVGSCLFFLVFILVVGMQGMCAQPGVAAPSFWRGAAVAFAGQFIGAVLLGLFYSTIVAFVLANRQRNANAR